MEAVLVDPGVRRVWHDDFSIKHTGHDDWLRRWRRWVVWVAPALSVAAVATNSLRHTVWSGFSAGPAGSNLIVYLHGPVFYIIVVQIYTYVTIASVLLFRAASRPGLVRRRQFTLVLVGMLFPFAAGIAYMLDFTPMEGLDFVPISVFFTSALLISGTRRFRVFDLTPIARGTLIEQAPDAVVVLDRQQRIVDLNTTARQLISVQSAHIGDYAGIVLPKWVQIEAMLNTNAESRHEMTLRADPPLHMDVRTSPLSPRNAGQTGWLILFRDITEKRVAEISLQ